MNKVVRYNRDIIVKKHSIDSMWQYAERLLHGAEMKQIAKQLTMPRACAYGRMNGHVILPRFYPCRAAPSNNPYVRWRSTPQPLSAAAQFVGVLHQEPPQLAAAEKITVHLQDSPSSSTPSWHGAVVSLRPGFGRTATALWAAARLGMKTVILAHSADHADRWRQSVDTFFPNLEERHENFVVVTAHECLRDYGSNPNATELPECLSQAGLLVVDDANRVDLECLIRFVNLWDVPRLLGIISGETCHHPLVHWSLGPMIHKSSGVWGTGGPASSACLSASTAPTAGHIVSNMYQINKHTLLRQCNNDPLKLKAARDALEKDLQMEPSTYGSSSAGDSDTGGFPAYQEDDDWIRVPRFYGVEKFGMPQRVEVSDGEPMAPHVQFDGMLKTESPPQQQGHDIALETMRASPTSGTLLNFYCGAGKTVLAVAIATSLHRRTLILVHTEDLLEQWIKRIETFAPQAVVGRLQQKTCRVQGCDFVVGMLQSLASREYPEKDIRSFGLCVVDECHRIACRYFSSALAKIPAAHVLGLSATAYRKDGTDRLMFWSCGPIRLSVARELIAVNVQFLKYDSTIKVRHLHSGKSKYNRARMLNDLAEEPARNAFILRELTRRYQEGRTIIVLSERKSLVKRLKLELAGNPEVFCDDFGEHTGDVKPKERERALGKRIILATYQKAREGLDVPELDTVFLVTPVSDVVQSVGRILRVRANKKTPLVVDIWDQIEPFIGSGYSRRRYYQSQEYQVQNTEA